MKRNDDVSNEILNFRNDDNDDNDNNNNNNDDDNDNDNDIFFYYVDERKQNFKINN